MKKYLFTCFFLLCAGLLSAQTTYYWVGGLAATTGLNTGANWNTSLNGGGSSRPSSTGASDILIFDGANLGGASPATGPATILATASITCAQMKFVNNVTVLMQRPTSGTSTITIAGEAGEDFLIDAGSILNVNSPLGSLRFALTVAVDAARVSGTLSLITVNQMRFDNTIAGAPGTFHFTNGSSFTTNITSSSSSYPFGSSTQSSEKWVVFDDGAQLYYEGGYSPNGNSSTFSAILFMPNSTWHHRAAQGIGSFFNKKSFGNIIVENNAALISDGPIYRINNLIVNPGSSFTTYSTGQTAVLGNVTVNGTLNADAGSINTVILGGSTTQVVSGTGTISVPALTIGDSANVILSTNITLTDAFKIYGKIDFTTKQVSGATAVTSFGPLPAVAGAGNTTNGSYIITVHSGIGASLEGQHISGPGIQPNTTILAVSVSDDAIYISKPATATAAGVALSVNTRGATLETENANGFSPANGSIVSSGSLIFGDNINYIIDGATASPFGITTGSLPATLKFGFVQANADFTVNSGFSVSNYVKVNAKITLRPADTLHILSGASITGTFGSTAYIATSYVTATAVQSFIQYDGLTGTTLVPLGTTQYYLPATITPTSSSDFLLTVFTGITTNGLINGTPFTATQRQQAVNAVWNINRLAGTGSASVMLNWPSVLEGSTFTTLPDLEIGLIRNTGTAWALPIGIGNNTLNTVTASVSAFGSFGAGAVPQANPFIFNAIPDKTYGMPDFNGGATSLNTTEAITYTSSNPAVATIVNGLIHITGAGSTIITASQPTDGFYPAASVSQTLTVNKALLTIKADDKTRFEALLNPALTITYTGFVLGETSAVLTTQPTISTTAVQASPPGTYPITVSGATAANYTITHVNGILTVVPKQNQSITFATLPVKTYGNPDFNLGGTSTNTTLPIIYSSSNTSVAIVSGNIVHITGAGTTTITATQPGNDGYFAATPVARTLTVNKANLTIRVLDTSRNVGQPNPVFTIVYTGFVLGETASNLTTAPTANTTATVSSSPGVYPITLDGAASTNYNITIINGRLSVLPSTGTEALYMNAYRVASGNIKVTVFSKEPLLGDIMIYDMNGRLVAKKNIFLPKGFINSEVVTPNLASGSYIVTIVGKGIDLKQIIAFIN
ncbi:MAG: MBG domain-containing protein [Ferruginibacter sp.]